MAGDAPADARAVAYEDLVAADPHPLVPREADDLGALMYTGGTTGRAKGVMLSHGNLWWCGRCAYERGRDTYDGKPSLTALPLSHAFGMIVTIVGTFIEEQRGPSVLMRWFEPAGWLRLAAEHRVGAGQLVPSMLALLLQQPVEEHDLSELTYLSVGAAPLPAAVRAEWERRVPGAALLEGYGCTESGAVISSSTLDDRRSGVGRPAAAPLPGAGGRRRRPGRPGRERRGDLGTRARRDDRLLERPRDHRRHPAPRAGCTPATSVTSTPTATSGWSTGRRTSSSAAGSTSSPATWRRCCWSTRASPRRRSSAGRTRSAARRWSRSSRPAPERAWTRPRSRRSRPAGCPASTVPHDVRVVDAIPVTSVGKTDRKALRAQLFAP